MRRVAIVGCSGAGKSTLARAMGERLGHPVVHMDVLYWRSNWRPISDDEMRFAVDRIAAAPAWISDGLAIDSSALRLTRADTIVWLDLPIWTCLRRAIWRVVEYRGRTRPDLAEGCLEKFDLKFYAWIWNFNRDVRPRLEKAIQEFGSEARLVVLKSDHDTRVFLASLPAPTARTSGT